MPIYEYQCEKCRRVSSFLVRNVAAHQPPACPKCGHPAMTRAFSRFAAPKGGAKKSAPAGEPALAAAGGAPPDMPDLGGVDENDPRAMGRMMRQMAAQSGESLPHEMDDVARRLESGENPEDIEADLGEEFGGESDGGGAGGDDTLYDA